MTLTTYQKRRNFQKTPEPEGKIAKIGGRRFVVQEHHASQLHFDFRLEMGGVLKSWAVPKGPSLDPRQKRLAVEVEDHPVDYIDFEGEIGEGNYGAGRVVVWDSGNYELLDDADPIELYEDGKLSFLLHGEKLRGQFNLIKMPSRKKQWLLVKSDDEFAQPGWELETTLEGDDKGRKERVLERKHPAKEEAEKKVASQTSKRRSARKPIRATISFRQLLKDQELGGDLQVEVDNAVVSLSHLDKLYWPKEGFTKGDLIQYYARLSAHMLPYLKGRPLILKRYPNGIEAPFFFQHDLENAPDFVHTESLEVESGRRIDYAVIDNRATLLYLTNLGTIEEHPWPSRVENIDHPDWMIFDLDPGEADWAMVCQVALALQESLARLKLVAYPKTSGSRGMHIFVPLYPKYDYDQVAQFAERVAIFVAKENPQDATVERSLHKRESGRVYIDHMQNAKGKSIAAPYSARARIGATVSAPLDWEEVRGKANPKDFTIKTMPRRVKQKGDRYKPVLENKQSLDEAMGQLDKMFQPKTREAKKK